MRPTGCPSAVMSKKTRGKDILVDNNLDIDANNLV